jgi:uncharacterized protein (TIGR03437 family)
MKLALLLLAVLGPLSAADPRWQQDLDTIATELPRRHPNLFFQSPRAVFDQSVADLRAAIPGATDAEVLTGLARLVALAGDGHTNLFLTQANPRFRLLPLTLRWFEDGLFVVAAADPAVLGARVLRIGDRSVDEAYQAVTPLISHENDSWVQEISPDYLVNADILLALRIAPSNATVTFEFEALGRRRFTLDLPSLDPGRTLPLTAAPDPAAGALPLYRQNARRNYWGAYIESSRTLYFAYNVCAEDPNLPFSRFNDSLWALFDSRPVDLLVIDLRNNSGGDSSVLNPFFQSGFERAERFAAIRPVVIIGRRTYSSAINNAVTAKAGPVTLVGEPSGGSPNSYGQVQSLVLPYSGLRVSYSTRYFSYPNLPPGPLLPDVHVPIYSADYFARHDPFLAAARAGAPPPVPPASGLAVTNAASFRGPVAPGSLAAIRGEGTGLLPHVEVNGQVVTVVTKDAPATDLLIPSDLPPGPATIRVTNLDGREIASGIFAVVPAAPGLFTIFPNDIAWPATALDNDNSISYSHPATPGTVIQLLGTGQGTSGTPPRAFMGPEEAEVVANAADPLSPGLWRIDVRVPESVSGLVPVYVTVGTAVSNAVTLPVSARP